MPVRSDIHYYDGVFFITVTCNRWLSLIQEANGYSFVYKWFDQLKCTGHLISGYVIMPNHFHALIAFRNTMGLSINDIVGTVKRFMSYGIANTLMRMGKLDLVHQLKDDVNKHDRMNGKIHKVFQPSFDWKECRTDEFMNQKLDYMHMNPCQGKWNLVENYWQYVHSSAYFYTTGEQGFYPVTHIGDLKHIDLTIQWKGNS